MAPIIMIPNAWVGRHCIVYVSQFIHTRLILPNTFQVPNFSITTDSYNPVRRRNQTEDESASFFKPCQTIHLLFGFHLKPPNSHLKQLRSRQLAIPMICE